MVSKGQFVGLDWNRITRLDSQVMTGTQEVENSLTASRCHLKAYPRCGQPTSKVSILKMKQLLILLTSCDAVPVETHKLAVAHHRVSSSSSG